MKEVLPGTIRHSIEQIRLDNTSGSVELAKKSAEVLLLLVNETDSPTQITNAAYSLIKAQPAMASIFTLVNTLMLTIDKHKQQRLKTIVHTYCKKFLEDLETSERLISQKATNLIKNNATIITHSYSSTVRSTLLLAHKSRKFSVICTESRPNNEGIQLAKQLGTHGIKVKLVVDSAVFSFISDGDIILVGGDAITNTGLINKIGTRGIAMTAQQYNRSIYALCSTIKLLPPTYQLYFDHRKNPDEIIRNKIPNVTPINYYFDLTPLDFLTGVITEKGIQTPSEIKQRIRHLQIHDNLA